MPRLLVVLAAAGLLAAGPAAAATCTPVNGHSSTSIVPPPACTFPLCTDGQVIGGLNGHLTVVAFAVGEGGNTPPPGLPPTVQRFVGQSVITMEDGDTLVGADVGAIDVVAGRVGTLLKWTGGTGRYANASGHIVINGVVDFAAGTVETSYRGDVCTE